MIDLARDYLDLSRGLVTPLARRGRHLTQVAVSTAARVALSTSLRATTLVTRPLRAVIK